MSFTLPAPRVQSIRAIARALGGDVSTRNSVLCPGPRHSRQDRSLHVTFKPDGSFVLHSFAGDHWRDCDEHVRRLLGLPAWEPGDEQDRRVPTRHVREFDRDAVDLEVAEIRPRTEDDIVRIGRAQEVYGEARDPRGTVVESYCAARALNLTDDFIGRYHPRCPWRNEDAGKFIYIPALIVPFTNIDDGIITGVHRIRLDQPERWPKVQRRMLGVVQRAAMMLGPVGDTVAITEGFETAAALRQLGMQNSVWALGSKGAISFFPVLQPIRRLIVHAEPGTEEPTTIVRRRYRRAHRRVIIASAQQGKDANDVLMAQMGGAR